MRFTVSIESDGAHADEDPTGLVAGALRDISRKVEDGYDGGTITDANGNTVGRWELR